MQMTGANQENTNVPRDAGKRLLAIRNYLGILGRELRWPLTQETVELLAKEVYRDEVEQRGKEALDIGEGSASGTSDSRLKAIESYLFGPWAVEEQTAETILSLVHHYGLLHQPVPEAGKTKRDILSQAKAMSAQAIKATFHALVRTKASAELERRVKAASQLAQTKSESEIYQTRRGDRVIPRFPTHEDRQMSPAGPRPEREVTAFLQVASRYLEMHEKLDGNSCVHCIAGILCIAEGEWPLSQSSLQIMKERIRVRLKDASRLNQSDYREALSVALNVDSRRSLLRHRAYKLSMAVLNTPGVSVEDQERAETELAHQFGLYRIYLVGVDHQVQHNGPIMIPEREKAISDFCHFLEATAKEFHISLMAEEFNEDALEMSLATKSIVQQIAERLGLKHKYCDPTKNTRTQLGLHNDRDLREEYWLSCLNDYVEAERILFVCGTDHLDTFSKKLTRKGLPAILLPEQFGIGLPRPIPAS
ncbi:MAG: hypothetical protein D4R81_05920 [Nitrospiraceae bacterium]|nr:MAG: hypothetical protein D4R81_05920 [Nitrospiraceae bacterium]